MEVMVEEAEVFTEAAVAGDFMEEAEEGFTAVEVSPAAAALVSAADIPLAGIVAGDIVAAASMEVAATTAAAEVMDGAAGATDGAAGATDGAVEVGVTEEVGAGAGAGDLDL